MQTFDFIETAWNAVEKRRKDNDSRACNLYATSPRDWSNRMKGVIENFQIGVIDTACYSQINLGDAISEKEIISNDIVSKARSIFTEGRLVFSRAFKQLGMVPDGNWSSDGVSFDMPSRSHLRASQKCLIDSIFAHRKQGIWYLQAVVTNDELYKSKAEHTRHFMQEFVPRNGTTSLQMVLPDIDTGILQKATTMVSKWGGTGFAIREESFDDSISPLSRAYVRNLVAVDLASDSITPSNIAILALPMTMNLIPIAFVADMHTFGMLLYVMVTDVFSTIPFLIKGVELIRSSRPRNELLYSFFSGNSSLGTMQSWIVECTGEEQFRVVGILFVTIAISTSFIGIAFELWAKRYMTRKKSQYNDSTKVGGPFGMARLDFQVASPFRRRLRQPRSTGPNTSTNATSPVLSPSVERSATGLGYSVC